MGLFLLLSAGLGAVLLADYVPMRREKDRKGLAVYAVLLALAWAAFGLTAFGVSLPSLYALLTCGKGVGP